MKSYLKFLSRNKLYTAIEAVGLIVSLAFVLLSGHYVWKQRQMTRNVPDYKNVYTFYRLSILGLIAMSNYFADESSKDIAIRKVFGSTLENEIWKTVLEYLVLLGVAAVIAVPIAILLASRLLEQYSYRISGYGWVFVVTVIIATIVAFLSILWQTLKAARTNPAVELKKE